MIHAVFWEEKFDLGPKGMGFLMPPNILNPLTGLQLSSHHSLSHSSKVVFGASAKILKKLSSLEKEPLLSVRF